MIKTTYNFTSSEISREFKDREAEGRNLAHLGNTYHDLGQYDTAIEHLLQSSRDPLDSTDQNVSKSRVF